MSAIFQRPLCELARAYDFGFRPLLGDPGGALGGPCDDRPHPVEVYAAGSDPDAREAAWTAFALCPEHEAQLREIDRRLSERSVRSRLRLRGATGGGRS